MIGIVLAFVAFLVVPVGMLAQKGEIVILGLAGAVLLVQAASTNTWRTAFRTPTAAVFIALLFWSLVTAAWALSIPAALELWKSLALIFAAMLVVLNAARQLSATERDKVVTWATAGLGLGLVIVAIEIAFDLPITRLAIGGDGVVRLSTLNAGISIALALVWPIAAAQWNRGHKALSIGLIIATGLVVTFSDGTSAKIAFLVTVIIFAGVWLVQRRVAEFVCLIAAIMILAAPAAIQTIVPTPQSFDQSARGAERSALHRLYIWQFATDRITEKPLLGWGLDSARDIPGGDRRVMGGAAVMSLHPHNAALQIWLELGAPGAALAALLVLLAGASLRRLPRLEQAASTAALFGSLTIAGLSFGIWQNWWMAALGLIAILTVSLLPKPEKDD